jgi:hypothetical protein
LAPVASRLLSMVPRQWDMDELVHGEMKHVDVDTACHRAFISGSPRKLSMGVACVLAAIHIAQQQ